MKWLASLAAGERAPSGIDSNDEDGSPVTPPLASCNRSGSKVGCCEFCKGWRGWEASPIVPGMRREGIVFEDWVGGGSGSAKRGSMSS